LLLKNVICYGNFFTCNLLLPNTGCTVRFAGAKQLRIVVVVDVVVS